VVGRLLATHRGYTDAGSVQAKAEYQFSAVAQQSVVHRHRVGGARNPKTDTSSNKNLLNNTKSQSFAVQRHRRNGGLVSLAPAEFRRNSGECRANGVRPTTRLLEAESRRHEEGHDVDGTGRDSGETTTGWHDKIMTDAASPPPLSRSPTRPCDVVPAPLTPHGVSNAERFDSPTIRSAIVCAAQSTQMFLTASRVLDCILKTIVSRSACKSDPLWRGIP